MTLAPPQTLTDAVASRRAPAVSVTAILVLRGPVGALAQTLDSLATQTRTPERLVVVDLGVHGDAVDLGVHGDAVETVRTHPGLAGAIADVRFVTAPSASSVAHAVAAALAESPDHAVPQGDSPAPGVVAQVEHLWVLTADSAAAPMTLARLLDAVRRSPSVGVAGPKLLDWERPGALHSVGVQLTRSGRLIPAPATGEPDQGQYDRRTDVLAIPATGMLVERALFDQLGGPDRSFGETGAQIDFCWRAQQTGRRVVVVPKATMRTGAASNSRPDRVRPAPSARRQARRVALARCATWALPVVVTWIALTSVLGSAALLVAKRPRAAWEELSDLGALLTPGRVLRARWRARGTRQVRRRDLRGLFVRPALVLRHAGDLIHDQAPVDTAVDFASDPTSIESGPVADEAQDLHLLGTSWASRGVRNPGLLAVLVAAVTAALATRRLGGSAIDRLQNGVVGGELFGLRAWPGTLWHAWLDGWHGPGLGYAGEQGPHLAVLAALSWPIAHLSALGSTSPVGTVLALLVSLAVPLAAAAAYLGGRAITHSPWPRALAALAWATTSALTTAVASGRLGALVGAVLLPLVAGGYALAARRHGTATVTAATILATAVLGAFVPALLVLALAAGLAVLLFGRGGARLRGLALILGPLVLLGPWVMALVEHPYLLLTGPGLSVWGTPAALPWQIALLHPGGPGSTPVLLSAPIVLAGVCGLLRGGSRGRMASVLAVLALAGLGFALAAPRLRLGVVPVGSAQAGQPITAWAGTGVLVAALALIAAAVLGADGLPVRQSSGGWPALVRWPIAAVVIVAALASCGWVASRTVGSQLSAWDDPRPAVAIDQAENGLGNRMLLLDGSVGALTYQLLGSEVGDVARALPVDPSSRPQPADLAAAVSALFEQGAAPGALHPARDLSAQAVGFVGLRAGAGDPRVRLLDSTAGLSRLGDHAGVIFWRVLAGGGASGDGAVAPSRARIVTAAAQQALPVSGAHASLSEVTTIPQGGALVLAEPPQWVRHAQVSVDGHALAPQGEAAAYALPSGRHTVAVDVVPTDLFWRYGQGLALLVLAFLALPLGRRGPRRRP